MRTWRVEGVLGLPAAIAARLAGIMTLVAPPERKRFAPDHAPSSGLASLPEITFDLSFLSEPPPEGLAMTAAATVPSAARVSEADLPEIAFDLSSLAAAAGTRESAAPPPPQWRERSLEDWFRQRAAEVAQRARERREPSPLDAFAPMGHAG